MSIRDRLFEVRAGHHTHDIVSTIVPRALARSVPLAEPPAAAAMYVWAMLRWERTVPWVALETCNVDRAHLERRIEVLLKKYVKRERPSLDSKGQRTVRYHSVAGMRALVDQADAEAKALGNDWCGCEHFMLAALVVGDDDLRGVFQSFCVERETLLVKMLRVIHDQMGLLDSVPDEAFLERYYKEHSR